jgi:hypothetical protein
MTPFLDWAPTITVPVRSQFGQTGSSIQSPTQARLCGSRQGCISDTGRAVSAVLRERGWASTLQRPSGIVRVPARAVRSGRCRACSSRAG